jgi:hypothetical protein
MQEIVEVNAERKLNITIDGFSYTTINPVVAAELQAQAARIKARIKKTTADIVDIGRDLLKVREEHLVDHGQFMNWVEAEIGISIRCAEDYMGAAKLCDKFATVAILPPATVYRLAAKSTPPAVVDAVVAKTEQGEMVPARVVVNMIEVAKDQKREARAHARQEQAEAKMTLRQRKRRLAARAEADHARVQYDQQRAREREAEAQAMADWIKQFGTAASALDEMLQQHPSLDYRFKQELREQLADLGQQAAVAQSLDT